ncbi:hypothetical protein BD779DRAFT_635534 [Infundibulicybe gibba]|nr:hypothetical protein BD779DRAFT_635534 [Infundibulicybe gibba]
MAHQQAGGLLAVVNTLQLIHHVCSSHNSLSAHPFLRIKNLPTQHRGHLHLVDHTQCNHTCTVVSSFLVARAYHC